MKKMMRVKEDNLRRIVREELLREVDPLILDPSVGYHVINNKFVEPLLHLWFNYVIQQNVDVHYVDKYFHCVAHCRATKTGLIGKTMSHVLGWGKEKIDQFRRYQSEVESTADEKANEFGRMTAAIRESNCGECWKYIPKGLPEEYWVLPKGMSIDKVRVIINDTHTKDNLEFVKLMGQPQLWDYFVRTHPEECYEDPECSEIDSEIEGDDDDHAESL